MVTVDAGTRNPQRRHTPLKVFYTDITKLSVVPVYFRQARSEVTPPWFQRPPSTPQRERVKVRLRVNQITGGQLFVIKYCNHPSSTNFSNGGVYRDIFPTPSEGELACSHQCQPRKSPRPYLQLALGLHQQNAHGLEVQHHE